MSGGYDAIQGRTFRGGRANHFGWSSCACSCAVQGFSVTASHMHAFPHMALLLLYSGESTAVFEDDTGLRYVQS
jgi:hypothetical protein